MTKQVAPYGSWTSPITTDLITADVVGLGELRADGDDLYWIEMRPTEGGRSVIVRRSADGRIADVLPASFNARTRVHEYGGASYMVRHGEIVFSHYADQRLYRIRDGEAPVALTPEAALRYADGVFDVSRERYVYVREDHRGEGEAVNTLVGIPAAGGEGEVLASGYDFYAAPRLSPNGRRMAWVCWNHPDMPWDATELWLADLTPDGHVQQARRVAGGPGISVVDPAWSPDGVLHYASDASGWWNIHRLEESGEVNLLELEAEFASPPWVFGTPQYAFVAADTIVAVVGDEGTQRLVWLDVPTSTITPLDLPYPDVSSVQVGDGWLGLGVAAPDRVPAVARYELSRQAFDVVRRSADLALDPADLSTPEAITFPSTGGRATHAFYYPPTNANFEGSPDEKPPLLVLSHGGPTSASSSALRLSTQYWTSRGIAVLDVNYGGSTGYGRAYRERLKGAWGIVDVEDCIQGALFLVERGQADGQRLAIRGGSAGGYTTLSALTFGDVFAAGASHYGVGDLEALARDTHKFESRYLDGLVGPYPAAKATYVERSPIHHVDQLACPVILFQGLDDPVVPPNQAQSMFRALAEKKIPVAYVPFEGEQHGFRQAKNIRRALEAELYFYGRIFGFEPADDIRPVAIENLD